MKKVMITMMLWMLAVGPSFAATAKIVRLATLEWEPYVSIKSKNNGYVGEVVKEAFGRSGYVVELTFLPWARAVKMTRSGYFDGFLPEYYSVERTRELTFSDPFPGGKVGLYKRKKSKATYPSDPQVDQTTALRGLQNYRFGVVRDYVNTNEFDSATFLQKEEVIDDKQNLMMLYKGRVDFIFIDKKTAEYIIHDNFPDYAQELEFLDPPLETRSLHIAFSKKAPNYQEKLTAFNSGLKRIKEDGTLDKILKDYGLMEKSAKENSVKQPSLTN